MRSFSLKIAQNYVAQALRQAATQGSAPIRVGL